MCNSNMLLNARSEVLTAVLQKIQLFRGFHAASLGKHFLAFRKYVLPSTSMSNGQK